MHYSELKYITVKKTSVKSNQIANKIILCALSLQDVLLQFSTIYYSLKFYLIFGPYYVTVSLPSSIYGFKLISSRPSAFRMSYVFTNLRTCRLTYGYKANDTWLANENQTIQILKYKNFCLLVFLFFPQSLTKFNKSQSF